MSDINTYIVNAPDGFRGSTTANSDGTYTVLLNGKLSYEQRLIEYQHELRHIRHKDFDKNNVDYIEYNAHKEGLYG